MKIRPATLNDAAEITNIQVDSYRTAYAAIFPDEYLDHFTYEEQEQDWRELLSAETEDVLLVAENHADKIVGYALGRPDVAEIPGYDAELIALHVRQEFQGQGFGRQLVAAISRQLWGWGSQSLFLWVLEENPACQFYENLGAVQLIRKPWQNNAYFGTEIYEVAYGWADIEALVAQMK